ncbi:MAG: hypothetical protein H0U12_11445 [Thermoleophilaceae bacterium]|nr:hypothetical protein [Thermoleophilaceae bacterium]
MNDTVSLHPTENRGYRELYVTSRALSRHWSRLSERIDDPTAVRALEDGVAAARRLLAELAEVTPQHDLYGRPAAIGLGAGFADLQNVVTDRFFERNQALRLAVAEVQHVRTLVLYLGAVGESRGSEPRTQFCRRWEGELEPIERAARDAAVALAADPDAAVEPLDQSPVGRAAHRVAYAVGSAGEWIDERAARRREAAGEAPPN